MQLTMPKLQGEPTDSRRQIVENCNLQAWRQVKERKIKIKRVGLMLGCRDEEIEV